MVSEYADEAGKAPNLVVAVQRDELVARITSDANAISTPETELVERRLLVDGLDTTQGTWHDFVFHVVWSYEAQGGLVEAWSKRADETDPSFDVHGLFEAVIAGHGGPTFGRRHKAGQDAHRRRFSRAVGAEKGQHFTLGDGKGHSVDCSVLAVTFGDLLNVNHRNESMILALWMGSGVPRQASTRHFFTCACSASYS